VRLTKRFSLSFPVAFRGFYAALLGLALCLPAVSLHAQHPADRPSHSTSSAESSTPVAAVPEKRQEERDESYEFSHSAAVQKFGSFLGLNTEQAATAFEIFNFLVLAVGVGFVLLKTLPKTFRARSSAIQKQLVDARTATEEANARLNSVEARLSKLDGQIAGMRSQAEKDSANEERRIRASVEEEKAKILAAAESEIQSATAAARRDIQQFAAGLAIEQAARKLIVTADTDRLLIENFARELTADHGGEN
jgi:F-type H+-transporting ATPase subunit b